MKHYLAELRTRFGELEQRERQALVAMTLFLVAIVLYLGVWSPLNEYVERGRVDHDRYLELLGYLKSTESRARAVAGDGGKPVMGGQSLLTTVSGTAQSIDVTPSRLQPEGNDAVSVWFETVPFTKLMLWLERLESQQGVVVRQITIDRRDEPGQVSARLVLRN